MTDGGRAVLYGKMVCIIVVAAVVTLVLDKERKAFIQVTLTSP